MNGSDVQLKSFTDLHAKEFRQKIVKNQKLKQ